MRLYLHRVPNSRAAAFRAMLLASAALIPGSLRAQDPDMPRFPFGTPVVFVPVQSVEPLSMGGWPGGVATEEEALRTMDAELEFALEQTRGAEDWALPSDVVRRVDRNPLLRMDPNRMAYQGLLEEPEKRDQIYEPLHGELRVLSALFDTRYVVLPIALTVEDDPPDARGSDADPEGDSGGTGCCRAHLLLAMIDIRMSKVVWWGEIAGRAGEADSPALLASLAERVAEQVAPS